MLGNHWTDNFRIVIKTYNEEITFIDYFCSIEWGSLFHNFWSKPIISIYFILLIWVKELNNHFHSIMCSLHVLFLLFWFLKIIINDNQASLSLWESLYVLTRDVVSHKPKNQYCAIQKYSRKHLQCYNMSSRFLKMCSATCSYMHYTVHYDKTEIEYL